jgi:hypothetical protein
MAKKGNSVDALVAGTCDSTLNQPDLETCYYLMYQFKQPAKAAAPRYGIV